MQIPSNMILTRVRPSLYLPIWACVWSGVSAATSGVHTFGQLIAVRLLLGIAEAPFFPGVFYLLSCWYTKGELGTRMAILYSGLVVATAFSGLIAAGVFSQLDGAMGLAGWRVRFPFDEDTAASNTDRRFLVAVYHHRFDQRGARTRSFRSPSRFPRIKDRKPEVASYRARTQSCFGENLDGPCCPRGKSFRVVRIQASSL